MHDQVKSIELLDAPDIRILHEAIDQFRETSSFEHIHKMSIFSASYHLRNHGSYTVEEYIEPVFYYGRTIFNLAPIFIDLDYKIVASSNGSLTLPHSFITCIDYYLKNLRNIAVNGHSADMSIHDVTAVQTWFSSFGHLHDELYILQDYSQLHQRDRLCLLDYHLDNAYIKGIAPSYNYIEMDRTILRQHSFNIHLRPHLKAKIGGLSLIRNTMRYQCFHSFPIHISESVSKASKLYIDRFYAESLHAGKSIFVSRKGGVRSHRLIANMQELETTATSFGINVVFPEMHSFQEICYMISQSACIIITWGSALTNLAYASAGSKVIVLRAKSYQGESLALFSKIISARELKVLVIDVDDNNYISPERLSCHLA